MEHRWGERFTVDLAVRVAGRPYSVRMGRLVDLSVSGAYLNVSADLRLLSRVQIAIALPQRLAHPTPMIAAFVARTSKEGVGVEWCEHAPKAVLELLRYVAVHRPERHRPVTPERDIPASDACDKPKTFAEA
jgi:PilZ domain